MSARDRDRELCGIPSKPGLYLARNGSLTSDPSQAETFRSADSDSPTWRPPPVPDAGRYSQVTRPTSEDVDAVLELAQRRLRLSPAMRRVLEALLDAAVVEEGDV